MLNIDTRLDRDRLNRRTDGRRVSSSSGRGRVSTIHLARTDEDWTWRDLRDYVIDHLGKLHGDLHRDPLKESGIFKSFLKRWGDQAPAIARYAFEECGGKVDGDWVKLTSFCRNSDPFFAEPISQRLS